MQQQLMIRLSVLVLDIAINFFTLQTQRVSLEGAWSIDSVMFIVIFNATLIMGIYVTDLMIVVMRKFNTRLKIGERVINGHLQEE